MAKKENKPAATKATDFEARLLEVNADGALRAVEEAGDKAVDLVEAWIRGGNAAAVNEVALSEAASSGVRKVARRGLNVLKSRGVSIPEHKVQAEVSNSISYEAWFLPPDQQGISMVVVGGATTGVNRQIAQVRVQQESGVIDVSGGEVTGSSLRDNFRRIQSARGMRPAPVAVEWARWYIARAREKNAASGLLMPLGFDTCASLLNPVPSSEPIHPVDAAKLEVGDAEIESRAKTSAKLHNHPEFFDWLPDLPVVQDMLVRVGQRVGPKPEENSEKISLLIEEEAIAATDRYFSPDLRARIAGRMKDSAISVLSRAGTDAAFDVLATAEAIRRAGLITSPPSEIPFLRVFFNKALSAIASQSGGQLSIPTPAEVDPQAQPVVAPPEALEAAAKTARGENP